MLKIQSFRRISEIWTKTTLIGSFLAANSLVWYYVILTTLQNSVEKIPLADSGGAIWIWAIHFSGLIISALVGASITGKIERNRALISWIVLSVIASFALLFLDGSNVQMIGIVGLILGVIFGFGMPSCISLFSDSAPVERRGRVSGLTILITGIGLLALSFAEISEGYLLVAVMAIWRLLSFAAFLSVKSLIRTQASTRGDSYGSIVRQKSFLLYLIPWLMFSLVNYLTAPLVGTGADIGRSFVLVQAGFIGVFGILGGFLIDSFGRKKIAVSGFVLLGIGTAVLAISQDPISNYFNAIVDGVAWGFLLVLFVLTLWGDLSNGSRSEKYYALGVSPFFISKLLEATIGTNFGEQLKGNQYAFFSFTTFFLLIAVLPLVYAPETLPEKVMKDRDLKSYVDKAVKIVQKETEEDTNKGAENQADTQENLTETEEPGDEDEQARKLAEKYY